jgi:hypothetical protein
LSRFHQQPHQVLPKDIPAVLLEEPLAHVFITEGQTQELSSSASSCYYSQTLNTQGPIPALCLPLPDSSLCASFTLPTTFP